MKLVLITVLLGQLTVTAYRSVPSQTDNSPWITSIGERVHPHGVAVSQDLLCKAGKLCRRTRQGCQANKLHYGDVLYIENLGLKVVNDCMNERHKNHLDVWVSTKKEEKYVGWRKNVSIWMVRSEYATHEKTQQD